MAVTTVVLAQRMRRWGRRCEDAPTVQIATNTPSGLGRRSLSLSREARTLSMSREAVSNLNQCSRVGTDRDGAASCGSKTLPWTAGMRKLR